MVVSEVFSQSPKNHLYLKNIKEYRENLVKQNSLDDTSKFQRCSEKVNEFLLLKRQYLIKLDAVFSVFFTLMFMGLINDVDNIKLINW